MIFLFNKFFIYFYCFILRNVFKRLFYVSSMEDNRLIRLESEFRMHQITLEHECENFLFYANSYSSDDLFWEYGVFQGIMDELERANEEYTLLTSINNHPDYRDSRAKLDFILRAIRDELGERGEDIISIL